MPRFERPGSDEIRFVGCTTLLIIVALAILYLNANRNSTRINTLDFTPPPNPPSDPSDPSDLNDLLNTPIPPELMGGFCHEVNPGDTVLKILREMGYSDSEALSALVTVYNVLGTQDPSRTGAPKYNRQLNKIVPGETVCTGSGLPDQLPAGRGGGALPRSSNHYDSAVAAQSRQINSRQLNIPTPKHRF